MPLFFIKYGDIRLNGSKVIDIVHSQDDNRRLGFCKNLYSAILSKNTLPMLLFRHIW
jgi:hypothetical protein